MPVEVRQRCDAHWIAFVALDHDRQPQAELAKPHRHWIEVDSENRRRQNPTTNLGEGSILAVLATKESQPLEGVHEKSARATRRIQDFDACQIVKWFRRLPTQSRIECLGGERFDQILRCIEGTASLAVLGGHQCLEGFAEYLRID